MTHDHSAGEPRTETGDAFADAFDGDSMAGIESYVRLVPSPDEDRITDLPRPRTMPTAGGTMFDPHDIERREYRLLSRALTNGDDVTEHLGAMTLVQLVKFLRAAGVSVPGFPETPSAPDPG